MRVFVTGASGWIGSATVVELVTAGHDVVGLARSEASATSIQEKGAKAFLGGLDDLDSLRRGAEGADAVIHLANKHDWANLAETDRAERVAVQTLAECLVGTNRAFVVSNGFYGLVKGRPATEEDPAPWVGPEPALWICGSPVAPSYADGEKESNNFYKAAFGDGGNTMTGARQWPGGGYTSPLA